MIQNVSSSMLIGIRDTIYTNVSSALWLIDDFSKKKTIGPTHVSIKKKVLFDWNKIPGNDDERLKKLLNQDFGIEWVPEAAIEKIQADRTIKVYDEGNEEHVILLELNEEKIKANLKIYGNRTIELIAKEQNGQLNICSERNIRSVKNPSGYYIFNNLLPGKYVVDIEPELYFDEEQTVCILDFESAGPAAENKKIKLKDASGLQDGDVVEFRNLSGDVEKRSVAVDLHNNEISWDDKLNFDFSTKGSTVIAVKYLEIEVKIKPRPEYPFPGHATLVRGSVLNEVVVQDAIVKDIDNSITTKTNKIGEFVLYYPGIKDKKIIDIEILKNSDSRLLTDITVSPKKTISLGKILFL